MTFDDLLCEVKKIKCEESRQQTESYCEVVVAKANLETMTALLQSYFGLPFKPHGQAPSAEASACAEPYGGIFANQIMYLRKNGNSGELALLWPWGSGAAVTVKIAKK